MHYLERMLMREFLLRIWLITVLLFCYLQLSSQCTNVTPVFTDTFNKSCGLPVTYTFTNTSTGTARNTSLYTWRIDGRTVRVDVGLRTLNRVFTTSGSYVVKLFSRDTSTNCLDSTSTTIVVTSIAPTISGGIAASHSPVWQNCITLPGSPNTYTMSMSPTDTLKNYRIEWGDSTNNFTSGSQLLSSQSLSHTYARLGLFNMRIITTVNGCTDTLIGLVINERNPVASILGPPSGLNVGCVPFRTRFINTSPYASPGTTFLWDMGDLNTFTLPASTFNDTFWYTYRRYTCNGIVRLTASNACGSSQVTWSPIQMGDKDSAILIPKNPKNCDLTQPFVFQNSSIARYCVAPNPRRYRYIWGDGTSSSWSSSKANISKIFTNRGTFNVILIDSNICGIDTAEYILNIDSLPISLATANPISGCTPLLVDFNSRSIGNLTSRLWNFGSSGVGNTSTDSLPAYTYTNPGIFFAVLSLSNICGTVNDTINIRADGKVIASFGNIVGGCFPYTASFTNTSTEWFDSGTSYLWTLPDGSTSSAVNPSSITINSPGNYTTTLIAMDSCGSDTFVRNFLVYGKPPLTPRIVSASPCERTNLVLGYSSSNSGDSIWWEHDDGKSRLFFTGDTAINHNYSFDSLRTYNNRLFISDINGCKDTILFPITVNPRPDASFTISDSLGCTPLVFSTTNNSTHNGVGTFSQMNFQWYAGATLIDTGDNINPRIFNNTLKDSLGSFILIASNSYNCRDSFSRPLRIYPNPTSAFTKNRDSLCGPFAVSFINGSRPNDTGSINIMSFEWDFGNGVLSNQRDTSVVFQAGATMDTLYIHGLIAISEHGCRDTSYGTTYVYPKPRVEFSLASNSGCNPFNLNINNNSSPLDTGSIGIMRFNWNFGNGANSSVINPNYTYNVIHTRDTGFNIQLIGISEHNCRDTFNQQVTIFPSPISRLSVPDTIGCAPFQLRINSTSLNASDYQWFFNNNLVDTNQNIFRVFNGLRFVDSTVQVKLTTRSLNGCFGDTAVGLVTILGKPLSAFNPNRDTFCANNPIQFLNESLDGYAFNWNFGDGFTSTRINPRHQFPSSVNPFRDTAFNISLITAGFNGCTDTSRGFVNFAPYPIAAFTATPTRGCSPMEVQFSNNSRNATRYYWDFGDGTNSTLMSPLKVFDNRGVDDTIYRVMLYAYYQDCVDTLSQFIYLYPRPLALFSSDLEQPCSNEIIFFGGSVNAVSSKYYFGDGDSSLLVNPRHTFIASPDRDTFYFVSLIATSNGGCTDTLIRAVRVPQSVIANFKDTPIIGCQPLSVQFVSTSHGPISHFWDFGDNNGSTDYNPLHVFNEPGVFQYQLKIFGPTGCVDSIISTSTITVLERPKAQFDFNPKDLRINQQTLTNYTDQSVFVNPITYQWFFNDPNAMGSDFSTIQNPTYNYVDSGNYVTQLIISNGECSDTISKIIRVEPPFPIAEFGPATQIGCAALLVQFNNLSSYASSYLWQFGDGDTSTQFSPRHVYRYPGTYDVSLIATGPGGIVKTTKFAYVNVIAKPFVFFDVGPGGQLFLPNATIFTRNGSQNASRYYWSIFSEPSNSLVHQDSAFNLNYTFTDTGKYTFMLVAINDNGCPDTFYRRNGIQISPDAVFFIPNTFAPDGDGRNDIFRPVMLNYKTTNYEFLVYNRWGEKVFETNDPEKGWDGTYNGKDCAMEVFIYQIRVEFITGDEKLSKGVVHLLR